MAESGIGAPVDLRVDFSKNPLGIDDPKPRLSWVPTHGGRGRRQAAYQLQVSAYPEVPVGDVWDSGKVFSGQTFAEYGGKPLESRKTYYWRVRWWDDRGDVSPWSKTAFFEVGLLRAEDWAASWITGGRLFRRTFKIGGEVRRARAYVSGLGYYELRINGRRVGDRYLDPGQTDYDKLVLYAVYDVTEHLRRGENAVALMLGGGRFCPRQKPGSRQSRFYGEPRVIAQIEVELEDGASLVLATDESWRTTSGPIVEDDIYGGEVYDARLEEDGWDRPGFDDARWDSAKLAEPPKGRLVSSAALPPIRPTGTLQPLRVLNPKPGVYVFDFGQNFAGWVRIAVSGPRGAEVDVRHAEVLNPDGTINTSNLRGAKATDTYILKGEGVEVYEPHFTYHGFRYAEVSGRPTTPLIHRVEGVVVHTDVEPAGFFSCSNQLLNDIHRATLWSQASNLMSVPTDCPQRDERLGWTGDAWLSAEEAMLNFDVAAFYAKWLGDVRAAQRDDGSIPDVVPPYWSTYPADPCWGRAVVVIPWLHYLYYGDRRVLEENYEAMKRWVDFLGGRLEGGILKFTKYGDWCPPGRVRSADTPGEAVSTLCYYEDLNTLSKIASILGRAGDAARYRELAQKVGRAYANEYLGKDVRVSQTLLAMALYINVVPQDKLESVLKLLVDDVEIAHDNHLNTGIIGTRYILDALTMFGRADLAYTIMAQTSYPSFGYMIREGATTLWERWELLAGPGMNSHNHIMFGSVDAWFYRALAGISADPDQPGFEKIIVRPHLVGDLKHAGATLRTVRGRVASAWSRNGGSFTLKVAVPVGSVAEVHVPVGGYTRPLIREGGVPVWGKSGFAGGVEGVVSGKKSGNMVVFEVLSGTYVFTVEEE